MPVHAAPAEPAIIVIQSPAQSVYDAAVSDRRAGRHDAALAGFQRVLGTDPDNLDARLNLGLTFLALGRLDEAEDAFEAVLRSAPDYVDARLGMAQITLRRGDTPTARRQLAEAKLLAPERDDVRALELVMAAPVWRFDVDVSQSRLTEGLPDWTSQRVAGTKNLDDRTAAGLSIERTERFGNEDVYIEGQVDRRFSRGSGYVAVGGAPGADYRPERALRVGGEVPLGYGIGVTIDAGVARFAAGTVHNVQPGLSVTLASDRLRLAARWIQIWDEQDRRRSGYAVRGTMVVTDRSRVTLSYADAPETSEGVTVDVQATGFALDVDLVDRLTARLGLVRERRGTYDRNEVALGIGVRF